MRWLPLLLMRYVYVYVWCVRMYGMCGMCVLYEHSSVCAWCV
jgi:hypothetical protein